jgi:general stress protein YciG
MAQGKSKRGFAAMSKEKQREIARKGGQASSRRSRNIQSSL